MHHPHLPALNNQIYVSENAHKGRRYPGEHKGAVDRAIWNKAQSNLEDNKPVKDSGWDIIGPLSIRFEAPTERIWTYYHLLSGLQTFELLDRRERTKVRLA